MNIVFTLYFDTSFQYLYYIEILEIHVVYFYFTHLFETILPKSVIFDYLRRPMFSELSEGPISNAQSSIKNTYTDIYFLEHKVSSDLTEKKNHNFLLYRKFSFFDHENGPAIILK